MSFSGLNYLAIFLAALAAFVWGAIWYMALSKPWMKAARIDPATQGKAMAPLLINSFVWELVMATVMAGIIGHFGQGQVTLTNGLMTGFIAWLGFMVSTMAVNHRYEGYGWDLTLIDGGHWLGVALIMGAIIGWFGT